VIYRQRTTIADGLLLHVIFPWLTAIHAAPLLRLAHIWTVPVEPSDPRPAGSGSVERAGVQLVGEATHTQPMGRFSG